MLTSSNTTEKIKTFSTKYLFLIVEHLLLAILPMICAFSEGNGIVLFVGLFGLLTVCFLPTTLLMFLLAKSRKLCKIERSVASIAEMLPPLVMFCIHTCHVIDERSMLWVWAAVLCLLIQNISVLTIIGRRGSFGSAIGILLLNFLQMIVIGGVPNRL